MAHENIEINLNLTKLQELLKKTDVQTLHIAKNGDKYCRLWCNAKLQEDEYGYSHALTLGKWEGKQLYVGSGRPSKLQPNKGANRKEYKKSNPDDMPF